MKRNFRTLLTLTALAATLAMTGNVFAGKGFSFGGGGGGGGGNMSGAMRSSMGSSMRGNMQLSKGPSQNFSRVNIGGSQLGSRGLQTQGMKPMQHMGQHSNISKHLQGQVVNRNMPNVQQNLL